MRKRGSKRSLPIRTGTRANRPRTSKRWRRPENGESSVCVPVYTEYHRSSAVITKDQKKLFEDVKAFVLKHQSKPSHKDRLALVNKLSARERRFLQELADSLHLRATWDEVDDYGQPLIVLSFDMEGVSEDGTASEQEDQEGEEAEAEDGEWESETGEGEVALNRVFGKYEKAKVVENTVDDFEETYEETMKQKMDEWKRGYYKVSRSLRVYRARMLTLVQDKLELNPNDESQLHTLVFRYVEGLQWVLNYYYKGCSSWGWFYDYHFAPRITGQSNRHEHCLCIPQLTRQTCSTLPT